MNNKECKIIYGDQTIDVEYTFGDIIYYVFKKRKKWVIRKSRIDSFIFTNMLSYRLDNGWVLCYTDRVFRDKNEAINFCLEQNKRETVKIYNDEECD